jgi:hypothetical protein
LVEQRTENPRVGGSIPPLGTIIHKSLIVACATDCELAINTLITDLRQQCEQASKGDLNRAEALLTAQAHTLDGIFNYLARKAMHADYLNQYETYLRLGLKAQSQ